MLSTQLSAEDQALLDQMRDDDAGSPGVAPEPLDRQSVDQGAPSTETEPPSDTTPPPADKQQQRGTVPLATFLEEKEERKRLASALNEERRARQLLDERTNLLLQRANQPAAEAETPIPTLEQDPVGHFAARQNTLERQIRDQGHQTLQQQQQILQALQYQAIREAVTQRAQAFEREFEARQPDYGDAVKFVLAQRDAELEALGVPIEQRFKQIQDEGLLLAADAIKNGRNPAELIYSLAKARKYVPAESQPAQEPASGTSSQPTPPAAAQRLQNIAAGQQQGRSLSQARGTGPVPMTAQRLLEMSPKEFDAFSTEHAGEFRDIMGR